MGRQQWLSRKEIAIQKDRLRNIYRRKYRSLFLSLFKIEGLDYEVDKYILSKIYEGVNLAAFKLNINAEAGTIVGFQPFSEEGYDLYSHPINIRLIPTNNWKYIPRKSLKNEEEVTLFKVDYILLSIVDTYVNRLVDIDMTIQTNLKLHKMPFIVTSDQEKDAIDQVLSDINVVALSKDVGLKSIQTNTPYIIDKLNKYRMEVETELLTIIGVKGMKFEKQAQMTTDEVNMNDEEINSYKNRMLDKLTIWFDRVNELFGTNIKVMLNSEYHDEEAMPEEPEEQDQEEEENAI